MENVMTLAELTIVTLGSVALALGLVWVGLVAAFHLLPSLPRPLRAATRPPREATGLRWTTMHAKAVPQAFKAGLSR